VSGYWENGQWKVNVPYHEGGWSLAGLDHEVKEAVKQAEAGTDAGLLLKLLFDRHPQLRGNDWDDEDSTHPLDPLVEVFAKQRLVG
jgi:hypothetical protein